MQLLFYSAGTKMYTPPPPLLHYSLKIRIIKTLHSKYQCLFNCIIVCQTIDIKAETALIDAGDKFNWKIDIQYTA